VMLGVLELLLQAVCNRQVRRHPLVLAHMLDEAHC
jgi:hypothetical protein